VYVPNYPFLGVIVSFIFTTKVVDFRVKLMGMELRFINANFSMKNLRKEMIHA